MIHPSREGREPGNALILQAFLSHLHEMELALVVFLQKEATLGSYPSTHAATKELAWWCTKQIWLYRGSPAKPKWHKVVFICSAALIATASPSRQWNCLPESSFWRDTQLNVALWSREWPQRCTPGPQGHPPCHWKESSVGCRISCFGDVNLDELQYGCVILGWQVSF